MEDGSYKIHITEFEQEKTFPHALNLIRIRHPEDVNVGVLNNQEIVYYKDPVEPNEFSFEDDSVEGVVKGQEGEKGQLKYKKLPSPEHNLLVSQASLRSGERRIEKADEVLKEFNEKEEKSLDGFTKKAASVLGSAIAGMEGAQMASAIKSVHFYLQLGEGEEKKEVAVSHPREKESLKLVNLENYQELIESGFQMSLKWTDTHNFGMLGLAKQISKTEAGIEKIKMSPEKITHSEKGKYKKEQLKEGELSIEPGETASFEFPAPQEDGEDDSGLESTFLVRAKGYYRLVERKVS